MADFNNKRFADRAFHLIGQRNDFAVRRRITETQIFSIFCAAVVLAVGIAFIVFNQNLKSSQQVLIGSQLCVLIGIVMYILSRKYTQLHRSLQAAEFMSAMFISALGMHYKFCLIVTPDGEIVYLDRGFQNTFPELVERPQWNLEELFNLYRVPAEHRQRVSESILKSRNDVLEIMAEFSADKKMHSVQLSVEPVPRPKGVILLRGKEL